MRYGAEKGKVFPRELEMRDTEPLLQMFLLRLRRLDLAMSVCFGFMRRLSTVRFR